jgi:opacity protein-like surface antigen
MKPGATNMKRISGIVLAAALFTFLGPETARAEVVLTPFVGSLFSGNLPAHRTDYGASATFMGGGIFGAEILFNYAPKFVPETLTDPAVAQAGLMGNLIVGLPIGGDSGKGFRPYVTGGIGLFRATAKRSDFDDRITSNDFAYNVGGGVMAFFNDHIGLRGDLRFVRTLRDDSGDGLFLKKGDLNFWRWNIGPSFRF